MGSIGVGVALEPLGVDLYGVAKVFAASMANVDMVVSGGNGNPMVLH